MLYVTVYKLEKAWIFLSLQSGVCCYVPNDRILHWLRFCYEFGSFVWGGGDLLNRVLCFVGHEPSLGKVSLFLYIPLLLTPLSKVKSCKYNIIIISHQLLLLKRIWFSQIISNTFQKDLCQLNLCFSLLIKILVRSTIDAINLVFTQFFISI